MIRGYIRRAALLALTLVTIYGLYQNAYAEVRTRVALQHTAKAIQEQPERDVRIEVREPADGRPTVDPETLERALRRAGIEAVVVTSSPDPDRKSVV